MATNKTTMALSILSAGGWIRHGLETQFRGGEKFEYRLFFKDGTRAKGFGYATLEPITRSSFVERDHAAISGSTARRIYRAAINKATGK